MPGENENENENQENPPPEGKPAKKEKTAADIVDKGKKTAREIQLEKEISTAQDKNSELAKQIEDLTKLVEGAKNAPSPKGGGKSLLDELNEFMGFGQG